ncbi:MAG: hypothetical protein JW776_05515 [Candidatus Lokiarchaeota archaeon]|nr:hypothetical protein [Candidatus Lokiarchaeota archaeon]
MENFVEQSEGFRTVPWKKHGLGARRRQKQWWYFEGLDPNKKIYYIFNAMKMRPTDYISLTAVNYSSGERWAVDKMTPVKAKRGNLMDISAKGEWGSFHFKGSGNEGWTVKINTKDIYAEISQNPKIPQHINRLYTKHINYWVTQFIRNEMQGKIKIKTDSKSEFIIDGYGYCEHNWGVQPGHSTTNWLHFWSENVTGIVMDCRYDAGIPHAYNYFWHNDAGFYLPGQVHYSYHPDTSNEPFTVKGPGIDLICVPHYVHFTRKKIWPIVNIDYQEILVEVKGTISKDGQAIPVNGVGKLDHNFNKW